MQGLVGFRNFNQPDGAPATIYTFQETRQAINPDSSFGTLPSFPNDFQQTILPASTPVTARFVIDTTRLPDPVVATGGTTSATQGPSSLSHVELSVDPWITATVEVGGFTFGSLLNSRDADPAASFPTPPFFTQINESPVYNNILSYGEAALSEPLEAFRTRVETSSDYGASTQDNQNQTFVRSSQFYTFDLQLFRFVFPGNASFPGGSGSFLGDPFALPVSFDWTDDDIAVGSQGFLIDQGFLSLNWFSFTINDSVVRQADNSFLRTQELDFQRGALGVQLTSVRAYTVDPTAVPEPSTMGLAALMLSALWLGRKRLASRG
ncbi:MAG: PEP-CTERM sorting domain-containing protein [Bryobacterales bacterium]|nr:PEP-CTERM sorting domain-containing protein [Bryobacterales bacterium]